MNNFLHFFHPHIHTAKRCAKKLEGRDRIMRKHLERMWQQQCLQKRMWTQWKTRKVVGLCTFWNSERTHEKILHGDTKRKVWHTGSEWATNTIGGAIFIRRVINAEWFRISDYTYQRFLCAGNGTRVQPSLPAATCTLFRYFLDC